MTTDIHKPFNSAAPQAGMFTPKLVTILRETYGLGDLKADIIAGLTVAVVALPLSMAIAIASGAPPERGLYAAIFGGFVVSLLGGSRFQIGGPAGAFIVLVAACIERHGLGGMAFAAILSGIILAIAGFLRLGTYVKYVPYPVVVGFTAGIAAIIIASQIGAAIGFHGHEPAELLPKLAVLARALPHADPAAAFVTVLTIALIVLFGRFRPHWPKHLIALAISASVVWLFHLPVETIASRFGGLPSSFPMPRLPSLSLHEALSLVPDAFAFALLGSIESLLSATVADGMTGRRHRSNCELVAQGCANIVSALFGGLCVTGAIVRTAANIRAGARGPIAGMAHAVFVLIFILMAARIANFIPLAGLAGVLIVVAWNMAEKRAFATLVATSRGEAAVLIATFLLTIFRDVTSGILAGLAISLVVFMARMSKSVGIEHVPNVADDVPDADRDHRTRYDSSLATDQSLVVYRLSGAFFFGTASTLASVLDRIAERPKTVVLDFSDVPYLDSSAAVTIDAFSRKSAKRGVAFVITGASSDVKRELTAHGLAETGVRFEPDIAAAVAGR